MNKKSFQTKKENILLAVLCILLLGISYPLMHWMILVQNSDLNIHALNADSIAFNSVQTWFQTIAHPFWHFCVLFLRMLGFPFDHAGVIVTAVTKVLLMLVVNWFYRYYLKNSVKPVLIPFLSFITVIVAAVRVPSVNPNVYINAGSPNPWHSPTQIMMMFWMMLCVFFLSDSYDRQLKLQTEYHLSWKQVLLFSMLLLASLLSKPVFVQCFFPGAAIYFLYQWIKHPQLTRYFIRLLLSLIPTVLFMLLQLNSYFGTASGSGLIIAFDPDYIFICVRTALLLNAFPLFVLLFSGQRKSGSLQPIVILSNICALAESCFFRESGIRANHGNWDWAVLAASFLMWVVAVPQYVQMLQQKQTWRTILRNILATVLLTWHFASGVYYLYYLFTSGIWY